MRFKKPKYGHYNHYCYDCKYYTFEKQVGFVYLGMCNAIEDEPTWQDAYDPLCGLWTAKEKKNKEGE